MKYLPVLMLLAMSFTALGQYPIKKDVLRTYCIQKIYNDQNELHQFNISPNNEWVLQNTNPRYPKDSEILSGFCISIK